MQEEKNNKFSSEYIRKYLDGQLPDREMQALEKAALEDPFLADAIEGFEEGRKHAVSFESGIADLKARLKERVRQRRPQTGILFQLSRWPIAASFILVIGLAVFAALYINKKPVISQTTTRQDTTSAAVVKPVPEIIHQSDSIKANDQTIASAKSTKEDKLSLNKKEKALNQNAYGYSSERNSGKSPAIVRSKNRSDSLVGAGNAAIRDDSSLYSDNSIHADSSVFAYRSKGKEKSEAFAQKNVTSPLPGTVQGVKVEDFSQPQLKSITALSGNYIKGVVVDEKGAPVPFAEVNVKGTNRHVFTDTAGFFKLYMKDPRLAALVFAPPADYESVSAELKPDSNVTNTIQFGATSAVLNETTQLKYDQPPSIIGWGAFYSYIDSNKKINTADSVLKGEEVISFLLYPDGKLSSFKIEKSVSRTHDAEILRLIQIAPALKSQVKKKKKYRIHIWFK